MKEAHRGKSARERRVSHQIGRRLLSVLLSGQPETWLDSGESLFYIRCARIHTAPGIIPGAKLTDVKFERKAFNPRPASDGVLTELGGFPLRFAIGGQSTPPSTRLRSLLPTGVLSPNRPREISRRERNCAIERERVGSIPRPMLF